MGVRVFSEKVFGMGRNMQLPIPLNLNSDSEVIRTLVPVYSEQPIGA